MTDDVVARLASFADLVELAVGNSAAWSALSREAATDELTGLPNRRSFYEQLRREIERAQRHQRPLSVVLMDIDHFKAVNGRFGHHAGDRVLAELGTLMRQVKREGELMARIGGEEFGWIVPETDGEAAMGAAERLRTAVGSETFSSVGEMTMSAGVCSLSQVADLDALVGGADQALYAAKREGRNRTSRFQTRSDDRS